MGARVRFGRWLLELQASPHDGSGWLWQKHVGRPLGGTRFHVARQTEDR